MKRFITVLMSAMIALSMMPSVAFAEETGSSNATHKPNVLCTGSSCSHAVAVGDMCYSSLSDALSAISTEGVVVLQTNIEQNITIPEGKKIELDLNGYTYTGSINQYGSLSIKNGTIAGTVNVYANNTDEPYNRLVVEKDVTIKNNTYSVILWQKENGEKNFGSIIDILGHLEGNVWVMGNIQTDLKTAKNPCAINIHDGASINAGDGNVGVALQGSAILNIDGADISAGETAVTVRAGKAEINGGRYTSTADTFSCNPNGSGTTTVGAAVAISQHTTKKDISVTINGGTFTGKKALHESNPQNNDPAPNVALEVKGGVFNGEISAIDASEFIKAGTFNDFSVLPYLADDSNVTINLDKEINLDSDITIDKELTLNLGGNTLNGKLVVNDDVIIKNGIINGKEVTYSNGAKEVIAVTCNKGNVTLSNVSVTGRVNAYDLSELTIDNKSTVYGTVVVWGDGVKGVDGCKTPTLNVYGTITSTTGAAISTNGMDYSQPEINIFDGATITSSDVAMYIPNAGVVNVNGGSITGDSAIGIKSGKLNIFGGTIIGNGANVEPPEGWSNGINSSGAAIQIESNDAYKLNSETPGTVEVSVSGGVIKSEQGYGIYEYLAKKGDSPLAAGTHLKSVSINGGQILGKAGSVLISKEAADKKAVRVTAGIFSSNPKAYVADGTNIYHQKTGKYFVGSMPASTSGYNAWALQNGVYEETYVAPAEPETPDAPVIDNSGSGDNASTNVDASGSTVVTDGKAEASIDSTTGDKIVENAKENNVVEVVIKAETEKGDSTGSTVALPESTVQALAKDTEASVTIKTDNATVTLDRDAVKATAEQAGTDGEVKLEVVTVENTEDTLKVELKLVTSKGTVSDFQGGNVTVTVPVDPELAKKEIVCVYIDDNDKYTIMEGSLAADGKSYTFTTGHFSTYAILEKAKADEIIADQNKPEAKPVKVGNSTVKVYAYKGGKLRVKASAKNATGYKVFYKKSSWKNYKTYTKGKVKTLDKTFKKLSKGKYTVKVKAYYKDYDGTKAVTWGPTSKAKRITVKK